MHNNKKRESSQHENGNINLTKRVRWRIGASEWLAGRFYCWRLLIFNYAGNRNETKALKVAIFSLSVSMKPGGQIEYLSLHKVCFSWLISGSHFDVTNLAFHFTYIAVEAFFLFCATKTIRKRLYCEPTSTGWSSRCLFLHAILSRLTLRAREKLSSLALHSLHRTPAITGCHWRHSTARFSL